MDWIKRNLYFVVGSVVAILLMGLAGFYFYSKWQLNNETREKLNADYTELDRLNSENPHPGSGEVNNIEEAKKQQAQLRAVINKTRKYFEPITPIPDAKKVSSQEFTAGLRRTIDQLQRDANSLSITIPTNYSFSFEAQKPRVTFAPGSLEPLSIQLGEVKAICDLLYAAKINSIDSIRRERVSTDDLSGPQTDYLETKSTTNELAVLTPYEITVRCFSSELAGVLSGFGSSPHGLLIKTINVEPAVASQGAVDQFGNAITPSYTPAPTPQPIAMPAAEAPNAAAAAAYARRYGLPMGGGRPALPGYGTPAPTYAAAPAPKTTGLQTVLDEKQLKVTINVDVIKLLPPSPTK